MVASRHAGLALASSLFAHGVFLLVLVCWSSSFAVQDGVPVAISTLVLDEGHLTLDDRPSAPPRKSAKEAAPRGAAEESQAFVATVAEAVPSTTPPALGEGPIVDIGPTHGGAGQAEPRPASGTRGPGLLRPSLQARRIVFAVDRSLSMGWGVLDAAREEVIAALESLPEDALFQVLLYNRVAEPLCLDGRTDLVAATEANRRAAIHLMKAMRPEGATDHAAALRRAILLNADTIYLVTDADNLTPQEVQAVTRLNRGRAAIHAVELRDGAAAREDLPLPTLCRLNRGTHRLAPVQRGERQSRRPEGGG